MRKIVDNIHDALPPGLTFEPIYPENVKGYSLDTAIALAIIEALSEGKHRCLVKLAAIDANYMVDMHLTYNDFLPLLEIYSSERGEIMQQELSETDQKRLFVWWEILNQSTYN